MDTESSDFDSPDMMNSSVERLSPERCVVQSRKLKFDGSPENLKINMDFSPNKKQQTSFSPPYRKVKALRYDLIFCSQ